jgi:excinuclease UvrABC ATPase subunit
MDADSHDVIEVRGARVNNLADISLDIPKRRLTVFTGTPTDLVAHGDTLTAQHLRAYVRGPDSS